MTTLCTRTFPWAHKNGIVFYVHIYVQAFNQLIQCITILLTSYVSMTFPKIIIMLMSTNKTNVPILKNRRTYHLTCTLDQQLNSLNDNSMGTKCTMYTLLLQNVIKLKLYHISNTIMKSWFHQFQKQTCIPLFNLYIK